MMPQPSPPSLALGLLIFLISNFFQHFFFTSIFFFFSPKNCPHERYAGNSPTCANLASHFSLYLSVRDLQYFYIFYFLFVPPSPSHHLPTPPSQSLHPYPSTSHSIPPSTPYPLTYFKIFNIIIYHWTQFYRKIVSAIIFRFDSSYRWIDVRSSDANVHCPVHTIY